MPKPSSNHVPAPEPLRPRDYLILLSLAGGQRHGYGISIGEQDFGRISVRMDPANLHRALKRLVRDGLVLDRGRQASGDDRRRFFELASSGRAVAAAEAARLEKLTAEARSRRLLPGSEGSS